jgi:hypothetical protein
VSDFNLAETNQVDTNEVLNLETIHNIANITTSIKTLAKSQKPPTKLKRLQSTAIKTIFYTWILFCTTATITPIVILSKDIYNCNIAKTDNCDYDSFFVSYRSEKVDIFLLLAAFVTTFLIGLFSFGITELLKESMKLGIGFDLTNDLLTKAAEAMKELGETELHSLERSELLPMLDLLNSITINQELSNSSELNLMKMYLEDQISKKTQQFNNIV